MLAKFIIAILAGGVAFLLICIRGFARELKQNRHMQTESRRCFLPALLVGFPESIRHPSRTLE
jgi:hypothetical protein